ncbi:MAG: ECF transporter S component [Oscillospiraceae bacterium]|nr:ECF transporter S component [Oscillospiraceae bacterium]
MSQTTKNLSLSGNFLALGLVLPFFIMQIPEIGRMLLPMHIPVLLCGLICGRKYGLAVGFILPLMRGLLFGMPALVPMGISMAFELAAYGFVIGLVYHTSRWKCILSLFRALIIAMIAGRVVWGIAMAVMARFILTDAIFTWPMFVGGALINAIPGIIVQLVLIPAVMIALNHTGAVPFSKKHKKEVSGE